MGEVSPADGFPAPFGRYTLLERLAVGGMAEIFVATATGEHGFAKRVVLKRLLPHLALDATYNAMFIDEAKLTARLTHPKIAQTHELGRVAAQLFIAMEFIEGIDVLAMLRECAKRKQRVPPQLAAWIAHEVLDALDYAHNLVGDDGKPLGIVHRDVSPSNVLMSLRGDIKLVDFGIARARDPGRAHKTKSGTLKGKYGYMSPEQVVEEAVDHRSDLFSVGVVLAEILTGRRLFAAANELDVLLMVRDAKLSRFDKYGGDIEPRLAEIVRKALRKSVDARWQSAALFREAIDEWLFDQRMRVTPKAIADIVAELHPGVIARRQEAVKQQAADAAAAQAARAGVEGAGDAGGGGLVIATGGAGPNVGTPVPGTPGSTSGSGATLLPTAPAKKLPVVAPRGAAAKRTRPPVAVVIPPKHRAVAAAVEHDVAGPLVDISRGEPPLVAARHLVDEADFSGIDLALDEAAALPSRSRAGIGLELGSGIEISHPSVNEADLTSLLADELRAEFGAERSGLHLAEGRPLPAEITGQREPQLGAGPASRANRTSGGAPAGASSPGSPASSTDALESVLLLDEGPQSPRDFDEATMQPQPAGRRDPTYVPQPTVEQALRKRPPTPPVVGNFAEAPDDSGEFANTSPLKVFYRILTARATGLLLVQIGGIKKEIYIRDGQPEYVSSNVANELFGNYLVAKNALSEGELAMALAMMPHYGGKLGDTLVGLGLMKPLEVFRHLTRQVRSKIIDVCTWNKGNFSWYAGKENLREAFPLDFNAFEILGAGAMLLPDPVADIWFERSGAVRFRSSRAKKIGPERFEVKGLVELFEFLDGRRNVGELVEMAGNRAERLKTIRMLHLLECCELARPA